MKTVEVYRGDGLRRGADISAPLLADNVLAVRGRAELDANAQDSTDIQLEILPMAGLRLGQLVEVQDPVKIRPYRAKITGISITGTLAAPSMAINLERPE
jgi:hypothetical protein